MQKLRLTNRQLIEKLVRIRNKRGVTVPFRLNVAQAYYWARKTRRNILLKARQKGLTKIIDADQLMDCIRKTTNAVVISHEKDSTQRLFAAVKFYVDNLTVKPEVSIDSKSHMQFPKRGSSYYIGTAGQRAFGRGDTVDRAHLSEAAFYPDLEKTLAGIAEAAEYGQVDIESTPNGREEFYNQWQKAKQGRSSYTPIFIPWFIDHEYSSDSMTEAERAGLSTAVREMFDIPEDAWEFTDEEKALIERVWYEHEIMLTIGQLKWRRYKVWDKGVLFFQEYPEDDVSCFLQSGRSVFSVIETDPTKRVALDDKENLDKEIVERLEGKLLYAGIDPAEGTLTGDSHVFSVIEPSVLVGKATVVFELHSNEPINVFAKKVQKVMFDWNISLGVEKQGVGVAMCNKLRELDVIFDEWNTTATTRPVMLTDLEEAYRKKELTETYPEAEDEARNMFYDERNRAVHPSGKHDDRVFSRAIALQRMKLPTPSIDFFG